MGKLIVMKPLNERLEELLQRRAALDVAISQLEDLQQRRLQIREKVRRINGEYRPLVRPAAA
jgi:hypothetical protein